MIVGLIACIIVGVLSYWYGYGRGLRDARRKIQDYFNRKWCIFVACKAVYVAGERKRFINLS